MKLNKCLAVTSVACGATILYDSELAELMSIERGKATVTSKSEQPQYMRVFLTFARNSLIRDMTFRANFIIECIASLSWTMMNLGFYLLIFAQIDQRRIADWQQYEFFAFIATTWIVNSVVQAFFMPNAQE